MVKSPHKVQASTQASSDKASAKKPARELELRLEKMLHQGMCLGRHADGRLALVANGIPGEIVRAAVQTRSGVLQGDVSEVVQAHSARVPTPKHSGLDYGHINYAHQLELKHAVVHDAYSRAWQQAEAPVLALPPLIASPLQWHYRHTVQPAIDATTGGLGYRHSHSQTVQPLAEDPSAHASINQVWHYLRHQAVPKGVREVVLRCNDAGEVLVALVASASSKHYLAYAHAMLAQTQVVGVHYAPYDARGRFRAGSSRLAGKRDIRQRYGAYLVHTSVSSFAQPNPRAASQLYLTLQEWVAALAHDGTTIQQALDMYAGSGIIAMHLCPYIDKVQALEIDAKAVARGKRDCTALGLAVEFIKADAKRMARLPEAQLITVDPPRAGLAKASRDAIVQSSAQHLIYVACDVATWARDVVDLQQRGFHLERVQAHDFYPHTHHIEMLSLLSR